MPGKLTRSGTSASLEQQGAVGVTALAERTDEVVFSGRPVADAESDAVWSETEAAVAGARAAVSGARRLLARYRVRSARDLVRRLDDARVTRQDVAADGDR